LHLVIGYSGLILIGLAELRFISVIHDTVGYALTMFGYLCLANYFMFAEDKIGVTTKEKVIFRIGFIVILGLLALFIYK
jgi:hypothetical protein